MTSVTWHDADDPSQSDQSHSVTRDTLVGGAQTTFDHGKGQRARRADNRDCPGARGEAPGDLEEKSIPRPWKLYVSPRRSNSNVKAGASVRPRVRLVTADRDRIRSPGWETERGFNLYRAVWTINGSIYG